MKFFNSTVPAVYRHKIIKKDLSDPFGYLYSLLFSMRRTDSRQFRKRQLQLVKSLVFSAFRPMLALVGPGRDKWKSFKARRLLRFIYSYRLPPFMGQRRSRPSQYSRIFFSKQSVKRFYYYFRERQLRLFIRRSISGRDEGQRENFAIHGTEYSHTFSSRRYRVLKALEYRLSSLLLRSRFFITPFQVRQAIVHGHVFVNGKSVTAPHQVLSSGDRITFSPTIMGSIRKTVFFFFKILRWLKSGKGFFMKQILRTFSDSRGRFISKTGRYFKLLDIVKSSSFARRLRKPFLPYHLEVNYALFSVTVVDPVRLGTLYFPTRKTPGSSSFRQFLGFYGV